MVCNRQHHPDLEHLPIPSTVFSPFTTFDTRNLRGQGYLGFVSELSARGKRTGLLMHLGPAGIIQVKGRENSAYATLASS